MLQPLIKLAEKGILPDGLICVGIRSICRERLRWAQAIGPESVEVYHQEWVDKLSESPIALVPEKANEQHYEVPPAFFEQVLGKHLKYSSGYWPIGAETLDESETAMLEMTCQRSELEDGMDILELGCGWGSLTCFMAARMPNAKIMAVSNSNDQRKYIEQHRNKGSYVSLGLGAEWAGL